MSKPKKNLEKARQIKGLGNSGLKNFYFINLLFSQMLAQAPLFAQILHHGQN